MPRHRHIRFRQPSSSLNLGQIQGIGKRIFGSDPPSKFYRKDESLPAEMRYYNGAPQVPQPVAY
jgi:hypothetical protein